MKSKKLIIALGLVALLMMMLGIAGCGSAENDQPINGESANPLEDITNPDDQQTMQVSGFPDEVPAASGTIEKLAGNTFDLKEMKELTEQTAKVWQVIFSPSTKVLRPVFHVGEGEAVPPEELSVHDLEEGQRVAVWGEVNGNRIFADTIAFMSGAIVK
ncbi:hypothetical protein ES703_40185 [subsurface metagenome]